MNLSHLSSSLNTYYSPLEQVLLTLHFYKSFEISLPESALFLLFFIFPIAATLSFLKHRSEHLTLLLQWFPIVSRIKYTLLIWNSKALPNLLPVYHSRLIYCVLLPSSTPNTSAYWLFSTHNIQSPTCVPMHWLPTTTGMISLFLSAFWNQPLAPFKDQINCKLFEDALVNFP